MSNTREWFSKLWSIHMMEHYIGTKNKFRIFNGTENASDVLLSEKCHKIIC